MIWIFGAGGHAKVVLEAIAASEGTVAGVVADDAGGAPLMGHDVQPPGDLPKDASLHLAIGDSAARARIAGEMGRDHTLTSVIHPAAVISPSAKIACGCFVAAGAIVGPEVRIGQSTILNHGAIIDHDCQVGAHCHVAPGVVLGGGAQVGAGTLVGARAVILPGISVGAGCTVGAGAVVTRNVADGTRVMGVPAR